MNSSNSNSYGQILKSTTIVGGAQGLNLVIGLVRTKLVAVLLGPAGVGLVGLYQSMTTLVSTVAGLGIGNSGVRQVAEANGKGDAREVARTVLALRRICWLTGAAGALLTAALAWPLSQFTFGNQEHVWAIALLGLTLLLGSVSRGQMALVQGMRRIRDLALIQVISAVAGTLVSVGIYAWLGARGIVPVLLLTAAVNLGFSWHFARRISILPLNVSWAESFQLARSLISLGLAFMWSALLVSGVALATRGMILRLHGMEANGLYQAAWGISGVFAGFILQAMSADFYPRLTAVAQDHQQVNQLVNEQTEVGVLLSLPGLLGTLVFSPWLVHLLYSSKFAPAAAMLSWFVLGIFGRVLSWPLGFIQLAKGKAAWFAVTEAVSSAVHLLLIWLGLAWWGLNGVAIAFAANYGIYLLMMRCVAGRLTGFHWTRPGMWLLAASLLVVMTVSVLSWKLSEPARYLVGGPVVVTVSMLCLRHLCRRLGAAHRMTRLAARVPLFGGWLLN